MGKILEQKLAEAGYRLLGTERTEDLILSILETKDVRYLKAIPFLIYKYSPKIEWIWQKTKEKNIFGQIVTFTIRIFQENGIKIVLPNLKGQAKLNYTEFKEEFELQKRNQEAPTLLIEKQKITAERDLQMWLSLLFTKKEKQIIQNILNDKSVSKTDYEYFSRKTKKKLNAILNLQDLARTVYHQSPKYDLDLFLLKRKLEEWLKRKKKLDKIKLLKFVLNENKIYLTYQDKTEIINLTVDLKNIKEKEILSLLKKYEGYDFSG